MKWVLFISTLALQPVEEYWDYHPFIYGEFASVNTIQGVEFFDTEEECEVGKKIVLNYYKTLAVPQNVQVNCYRSADWLQ